MNRGIAVGVVILIVAVSLMAAYIYGFFNSGHKLINQAGNACIGVNGYTCSSAALHNGTLTAVIGQSTGTTLTQANIFIVNGSQAPTAVPPLPCEQGVASWASSGTANLSLAQYSNQNTCIGFPATPGQEFNGTVWIAYRMPTSGSVQMIGVARINLTSS